MLRLADGTLTDAYSIGNWDAGRHLLVLHGIGSIIVTTDELTERLVEI